MRISQGFLLGYFLLSAGWLSGCGDGEAADQKPKGRPPALVRVAQLEQKPLSRQIIVVGNVTPVRTSVVASGANGVVQYLKDNEDGEALEIEMGQFVKEGTVLSQLRMETTNREIDQAEAMLEESLQKKIAAEDSRPEDIAHATAMMGAAQAVETNMRQKWERAQTLYNRGVATDAELEDAQEKYKAASEALNAANKSLKRVEAGRDIQQTQAAYEAQASYVEYLKKERDKRTTKAPFSGFVVKEHTYLGQWLAKGDPVVTLARMDEVDVIVHVDQADIPHVRLGQSASVHVEGAGSSKWTGRIVHIVPQSDWERGSRSFPVVVRIPNTINTLEVEGLEGKTRQQLVPELKAGMMARVTFRGSEHDTLLAPKDALVRTTRGTYVFVYEPVKASAALDPHQPTMGAVHQVEIEADLHMSDGEMIGIRVKNPTGKDNKLASQMWVVTEGGERLAPVQDHVNALSQLPKEE